METIHIGLSTAALTEGAKRLNLLLADEHVLYIKSRHYHWNVTGPDFASLHAFFESHYDQLEEVIDEVAERIRMLGDVPMGSMKEFISVARLGERSGELMPAGSMVTDLLASHEALIRTLRDDVGFFTDVAKDVGTSDFLTGLIEKHEKMAWMLRATGRH